MTKRQHYIPQVYLRGFSPEYFEKEKRKIPLDKYTIYCHDLTKKEQLEKPVPIKSVCYEDYLYEVTGNDGKIVSANSLERFFSIIEKMFGEYRHTLERKAFIEDNYKTKCFLTKEEKAFWITYILIQILRTPQILELAEQTGLEIFGNGINEQQAKNIARMVCLPFFRELKEESREVVIFNSLLEPMKGISSFGVGIDTKKKLITANKPIFLYSKEFPCKVCEKVIFPITSQICLFLFRKEEKCPKNFLFEIDDDVKEEIIKSMTSASFQKIYSNHILDETELKYVEAVLRDKGGDIDALL